MRLNHATLIVSDFERSLAFYRGLGLQMIVHVPPRYARFVCPVGDATLSIEVTAEALEPAPASARVQLFFECDDLDARFAKLQAAGYAFTQPPTDMDYLWREARLRDPDGHDIRLYHAGSNRLDPPWKVTTA